MTAKMRSKIRSLVKLKKDLWKLLSELVRREELACFTCDKEGDWKNDDGGHYYHGKKFPVLYFDRRNVHRQCTGCNRYRNGNLTVYANRLENLYGYGILQELDKLHREIKPPREFFENKLSGYTQTLERLRRIP